MQKPGDVFDMMLANKVGACFAKTFISIADYYEKNLLDYRKADKIHRMGFKDLSNQAAEESKQDRRKSALNRELKIFTGLS